MLYHSNMKYDAIIFDVDGTLWNACAVSAKGMNSAMKELNIEKKFSAEEIEQYSGKPSNEVHALLFGNLLIEYPNILASLDTGEKNAINKEGGALYEGVREGIKKLSENASVFLVSNCQSWYLDSFIEFADLAPYLSGYNCYGTSKVSKAEMLAEILKNHTPRSAVYIGDTIGDMNAAAEAGIDFIGAKYGFGNVDDASYSFDTFFEIIEWLLKNKN